MLTEIQDQELTAEEFQELDLIMAEEEMKRVIREIDDFFASIDKEEEQKMQHRPRQHQVSRRNQGRIFKLTNARITDFFPSYSSKQG